MLVILDRSHIIAAAAVLAILMIRRTLHQSYGEEEDDLTAWDSLEELRPPPKMATGAVVRQELPLHTQKARCPLPCNPITVPSMLDSLQQHFLLLPMLVRAP